MGCNQALVVAEAGIERARSVLNNPVVPRLPALLTGSTPAADEVPGDILHCRGEAEARGAILVDKSTPACTTTPCTLQNVSYPSVNRSSDLPASAGLVAGSSMGKYTVYIRQDLADCRMGNPKCDQVPSSAGIDGGVVVPGGGVLTCDVPAGAPIPNGIVVIRSEGVASDGRTRVVLEVTMAPSLGAQQAKNTPLSALCASGASGCDDNASVQNGIVVTSTAPPSAARGHGRGLERNHRYTSRRRRQHPRHGRGTGHERDRGHGGSTGCVPSSCPSLATMGLTGLQPSVNFKKWLADHSSTCNTQDLDTEHNVITDALLAPYKVIIVLDVGHLPQDYTNYANLALTNVYQAALNFCQPNPINRQFSAAEGQAVKRWVDGGGGLLVTQGYGDGLKIIPNFNTLVEPLGLVYYSPGCGLNSSCTTPAVWEQDAYGNCNHNYGNVIITSFAAHPITTGMTKLYAAGFWPISGYPTGSGFPTTATPLGSSYQVLVTYPSCKNVNSDTTFYNLNFMVAGTSGAGRVLAVGDEWLTFDANLADPAYGPTAVAFWTNAMKWLGQCP